MKYLTSSKNIKLLIAIIINVAFLFIFYPFMAPIIMAGIFAFAFEPILKKYQVSNKKRKLPTILLILSFSLFFILSFTWVLYRIIVKVKLYTEGGLRNTSLYTSFSKLLEKINYLLSGISDTLNLDLSGMVNLEAIVDKTGGLFLKLSSTFLSQLPEFILAFFIFVLALYYFITEARYIKKWASDTEVLNREELNHLVVTVQKTSYATLMSSLVIGSIQALTVTVAGYICGYHEVGIVFLTTFIFSFIPVIGAAPMAILLALMSVAQAEYMAGLGLLVASGVAGTIDNILKPILISNSVEDDLHPIVSLVAIIGAVLVYGIAGLFLGPILTQLVIKVVPILLKKESAAELTTDSSNEINIDINVNKVN